MAIYPEWVATDGGQGAPAASAAVESPSDDRTMPAAADDATTAPVASAIEVEVDVAPTASIPIVEAPGPAADRLGRSADRHRRPPLLGPPDHQRDRSCPALQAAGHDRARRDRRPDAPRPAVGPPTSPSGRSSAPPGRSRSRSGPAITSPASSRSGSGSCSPRRARSTRSTSSNAPASRASATCGSRPRWSGSRSAGPARRSRATWPMRSRWPPVDSSPS